VRWELTIFRKRVVDFVHGDDHNGEKRGVIRVQLSISELLFSDLSMYLSFNSRISEYNFLFFLQLQGDPIQHRMTFSLDIGPLFPFSQYGIDISFIITGANHF
jgi:hypothetical protein